MSDQEKIFDENAMETIMDQEQEKEITKISLLQGQSIGLITLLLEKGVLKPEDVIKWEGYSEQASDAMKSILTHSAAISAEQFVDEEDELRTRIGFLEANIKFGKLLHHTEEELAKSENELATYVNMLKELISDSTETD